MAVRFAGIGIGLAFLLFVTFAAPVTYGQAAHVRWDIVTIDFAAGTVDEGGIASALAADGSKISVRGTGTFVAPGSGGGSSAATGGGNWETRNPTNAVTGSGTYRVRELVSWTEAPGTLPPLTDLIGGPGSPRAGLAVLQIDYLDGSSGILVVSCHLVGTPDSVLEGITASKGFVDYFNAVPPAPGVDANRTLFHR